MKKIYSKVKPDTLLHLVHRLDEIKGRTNVAPENEFIQLATLKMKKGTTFKPHKHIWKDGEDKVIAQESWVVIKGKRPSSSPCVLFGNGFFKPRLFPIIKTRSLCCGTPYSDAFNNL